MVTFGSSIICMDHLNFQRDVELAVSIGIDFLHLDVMDGNFVPRYGIYPEVVRRISEVTSAEMDLHLMVRDPEFGIDQFSDIDNIRYVSIHFEENETNIRRILDKVNRSGKKAGIVLNLDTPVSVLQDLIKNSAISSVMLMGIRPGVLIQKSKPETVERKVRDLVDLCDKYGELDMIQCDGGVTFETIPWLAKAGINNFVCGSSTLYKGVNLANCWEQNAEIVRSNFKKMKECLA